MDKSTIKLKKLAMKFVNKGQYENALSAINAAAQIMYEHNQVFTDSDMEGWLCEIEEKVFANNSISWTERSEEDIKSSRRIVLYYDAFGLDVRGVTISYTLTLVQLGYKLVYVTHDQAKDIQPELHHALRNYDVDWVYYKTDSSYVDMAKELISIFNQVKPDTAYYYTVPNDVSGYIAFRHYRNVVKSYLIDLTDHAFWLGIEAVDYVLSSREVGNRICYNLRKIPEDRIIPTVVSPTYTDFMAGFEGYPFADNNASFIFSGGSLYKTLGDDEKKYYKMVRRILTKDKDVLFWYAGDGDSSELDKLRDEFPNRVFHTHERKDFIQVMKRCKLYLNTYPFLGGLMTRYSIALGKIPMTLKHNEDSRGMARNQSEIKIEYETVDELVDDAVKLLADDHYLKEREFLLKRGETLQEEYLGIMRQECEKCKTDIKLIKNPIDMTDFIKEYDERFDEKKAFEKAVLTRKNFKLMLYFPLELFPAFLKKSVGKVAGKI